MSDRLIRLAAHPVSRRLIRALGLPTPVELVRSEDGNVARPFERKLAAVGGAGAVLARLSGGSSCRAGATVTTLSVAADQAVDILLLDAIDFASLADLRMAYDFFHSRLRALSRNGRVLILAPAASDRASPTERAVTRGLEGFCRSLGKEIGRQGAVANLLHVEHAAIDRLDAPIRFFAGVQSSYVGGQTATVSATAAMPPAVLIERVLDGRVALVTGAARGIGAATAARLAQEARGCSASICRRRARP